MIRTGEYSEPSGKTDARKNRPRTKMIAFRANFLEDIQEL